MDEIAISRNQLAHRFLNEHQNYVVRCSQVRNLSSIFKNGAEPITIKELSNLKPAETRVMLLNLIHRTLVFHGSEHDVSDEAGLMLCDEIIEWFPYMSMAEIGYAINHNLTTKKFGTLSAAEILNWIKEYDCNERLNAVHINQTYIEPKYTGKEISYEEWLELLAKKAEDGDKESQETLERIKGREGERNKNLLMYRLYRQIIMKNEIDKQNKKLTK